MKNKKSIILFLIGIIIVFILVGCKKTNMPLGSIAETTEKINEKATELKESDKGKEISKTTYKFNELIANNKDPKEIANFLDENLSKVGQQRASKMIIEFISFQENYAEKYSEELKSDSYQFKLKRLFKGAPIKYQDIDNIKDENLKALVKKIYSGHYRLNYNGTVYYPVVDYDSLKKYNRFLTNEMKEYIIIMAKELNNPTIIDKDVMVSWEELGIRLLEIEKYIKKYSDGIKWEDMMRKYGEYFIIYIGGSENTSIYDSETDKIKKDVVESYRKMVLEHSDTITGATIGKYLQLIEDNEFIIDDDVESHIIDIYTETLGRLDMTANR